MIRKPSSARPNDNYEGGQKRIFIGLLSASCAVLCLVLLLLTVLPWLVRDAANVRFVGMAIGIICIIGLAWMCLGLVFNIGTGRALPGISGVRHVFVRLLLPMMEIVGKFFGIDKNLVRRSFIKMNNELALDRVKSVKPEEVLLLLPHCIQNSHCPRRLTYAINNCVNCGGCQIGAMRKLSQNMGFRMAVATGGTIARRIVVECRPKCIVAVACERDLTSGIQDSYPIPVYGVLNLRPHGPCKDTQVQLDELIYALAYFMGKKDSQVRDIISGAK